MKITLIRQDSGSGKEALSICEAGTLFNKMKTETKSGHITALRNLMSCSMIFIPTHVVKYLFLRVSNMH